HAGLEAERWQEARCTHRKGGAEGAEGHQVELALLRQGARQLVPQLSLLQQIHQGHVLSRQLARTAPAGNLKVPRSALLPHPRRRRTRREAVHLLGEAGREASWREDVIGQTKIPPPLRGDPL